MLQNLLRLGLYQIFWLDRIPDHAAVHETVELAKQSGFGPQAGFVNAVLRGYLREVRGHRSLAGRAQNDPAAPRLFPSGMAGAPLAAALGRRARRAVDGMEQHARPRPSPASTRLKTEPGKLLAQWRDENVEYDFVRRDWVEENLVFELKSHPPLNRLPSFQQGLFYVQDPSTLLAVRELDPQPGETVLDLCAAPGGKLDLHRPTHAQRRPPDSPTTPRPNACKLVRRTAPGWASPASKPPCPQPSATAQPSTLFDRILVDAPCSNTGVMRRRVDLRWRIRPEEIGTAAHDATGPAAPGRLALKPGGTWFIARAAWSRRRTEEVVSEFLAEQADSRARDASERESAALSVDQVDGAYVARLVSR